MAIEKIDPNTCIGCGTCKLVCSSDVIALREEDGKAYVKYPEDCIVCLFCEQECPTQAIYVSPTHDSKQLQAWG